MIVKAFYQDGKPYLEEYDGNPFHELWRITTVEGQLTVIYYPPRTNGDMWSLPKNWVVV